MEKINTDYKRQNVKLFLRCAKRDITAVMRKQSTQMHENDLHFTDTKDHKLNLLDICHVKRHVCKFFSIYSPSWPSRIPSHSHVAVLQIRMVLSCDPVTLKPSRRHGMTKV